MPALRKFTTTYSESEDRLRLAGETTEGAASVALWLTQRLMNRLVTVIAQWLEADTRSRAPHSLDAELHNAFIQEAATRRLEPAAPVATPLQQPPTLVISVDLRREDDFFFIIFRAGTEDADPPFMRLSPTELRQWLGILHGLYRTAGWPFDAWPEWFSGVGHATPQAAVLH